MRIDGLPTWNSFADASELTTRGPASFKQNADRMYSNAWFYVFCFYNKTILGMPATKVLVCKADTRCEFTPQSMSRLKLNIFGPDTKAIHYYGSDAEHANDSSIYCMWVLQ